MIIANRITGPVDFTLISEGRSILSPGEALVIGMRERGASLSVSLEQGSPCAYALAVSQSALSLIEADEGIFIPDEQEDHTATGDYYIAKGSAFQVVNRGGSSGAITVDWRL